MLHSQLKHYIVKIGVVLTFQAVLSVFGAVIVGQFDQYFSVRAKRFTDAHPVVSWTGRATLEMLGDL